MIGRVEPRSITGLIVAPGTPLCWVTVRRAALAAGVEDPADTDGGEG